MRVFPPPGTEEERHITTYTLGINDGDPLKIGFREREIRYEGYISVDFDVVTEVFENTQGVLEFEFVGEPVQNIVFIAQVGRWRIAEFEIYADGFAVSSDYASGVIDLGQTATLGPLTWSGALHPGAHVDLRVRSGDTPDPHLYYRNTFRGAERSRFNAGGSPLDRNTYFNLEAGEQGGIAPRCRKLVALELASRIRLPGCRLRHPTAPALPAVQGRLPFRRSPRSPPVCRHPAPRGDPRRGRDRTGSRPRRTDQPIPLLPPSRNPGR